MDLLTGSAVVIGVAAAAVGTCLAGAAGRDPTFGEIVDGAVRRYLRTTVAAREFARGKLRADPVYRTVVAAGVLPAGGTLLDVGCGQGLTLAVLVEARRIWSAGRWPASSPPPPAFRRFVGIEVRPRIAAIARRALEGEATIVEGDIRDGVPERCDGVLLFDVLHMLQAAEQQRVLEMLGRALQPGGVMLVREAEAGAGWRFELVRAANRLKALAFGNWDQRFHFRSAAEWTECFEALGFRVQRHAGGTGPPFANVLFVLERAARRR